MSDFRAADHAMGVELQIEEATEQRERAVVQGRSDDAARLEVEIDALQDELAETAERAVTEAPEPETEPELHNAEELNISEAPT